MKVDAEWNKSADMTRLRQALAGFDLFAVGGCVRNELLDRPITDIDLATNAHPDQVQLALERAEIQTVPTGIDHGTVTAVLSEPYEITTFRKDVATDGRRAVVAFAESISEDSLRRDFTVNALYLDGDGRVHDPQGGLADLDPFRLRFIGNAAERIGEDYLRILRFFRFFAQYGDAQHGIDADGLAACAEGSDGLVQISRERIGAEMMKLLEAPDPSMALAAMVHSGVMRHVLPGADANSVSILTHLEDVPPNPIRRLAALGEFDLGHLLRSSKQTQKTYSAIRQGALSDQAPAVLGYELGDQMGWDAVLVRSALMQSEPSDDARTQVQRGAAQTFPLVAADLADFFQGADLGRALKTAKHRWIESDFALTRDALVQKVQEE